MLRLFGFLLKQELLSSLRSLTDWLNPVFFYVLVVIIFPLGITAEPKLLQEIAPGLLWVAALLALLLGLPQLFRSDYDDGILESFVLSPQPLPVLVSAKLCAHWLKTITPLALLSPLLGICLHMSWNQIFVFILTLLLGTPSILWLGAIILSLVMSLRQNGLLIVLLLIPLTLPILIFAANAVAFSAIHQPINGPIALLAAIFLFTLTFAPWVLAATVRMGLES